jgi:hypothetical protein
MILKVHPHKIEIDTKEPVNEKEINVSKCHFIFDDTMPADMVKEAYFTYGNDTYKQIIVNDECDFPHEVLNKKGTVEIGVVPFKLNNGEYEVLYNPSPVYFETWVGSLKDNPMNSEEVTPSDKEQMEQLLQEGLDDIAEAIQNAENLDIDAEKVDTTTTVTITKQDGSTKTVSILDGEKGEKGDTGEPGQIKMLVVNELPTVGEPSTLYFVPKEDAETSDLYYEYVWLNNKWELLGEKQIVIDLSDYYTKQETNNLLDNKADTEDIPDLTDYVKNTDYATDSVGGVIKTRAGFNFDKDSSGRPFARTRDYETYNSQSNDVFISKGTLENVLNARIGDIDTILTTLTTGNGV